MMELFLNLAWLLLAVPAYWVWQRRDRRASCRYLLTLGCTLVLLFPVISATDDLHAMSAEMEEFSPGKRALKHASGDKVSLQQAFGAHSAQLLTIDFPLPTAELCGKICPFQASPYPSEAPYASSGRAPPLN